MSHNFYKDSRYHGLVNQGATCYLNSVLQVLFMTKDFREAVQRKNRGNPIDVQLASLFDDLETHTARTVGVTKELGIRNVCEQRDAAEHFEKILTMSSSDVAQVFRGKLAHKTICSGCQTETDEDAAFWDLPLPLVSACRERYSVDDGIQEFFRDSAFTGENQMYCDKCDAKCDATAKCVMKHHPEVLMLLLKRFEFSYHQMRFVKNGCSVDVPAILKIPENQMYELYAFVEHFGSLKGGHYTATIKPQDDENRWYCFNDSSVTLLNNQPFQSRKPERTKDAYLLFYRKKRIQDITEESNNGGRSFKTKENYEERSDVNKRSSVKRKVPHQEYSDHSASKQMKEEERKKGNDDDEEGVGGKAEADQIEMANTVTIPMKRNIEVHEERTSGKEERTQAERLASRTDRHSEKRDSHEYANYKTSVSFHKQALPNKQEQQGDKRMKVHSDTEQMTGVNKPLLRDGVHDKQNRPNKSQNDERERNTPCDELNECQQKQNRGRKMGDAEVGMHGRGQGSGHQADRGKDEMSTQSMKKPEVKTDKHRKTGHEGHEERVKEKEKKTEAGGLARNEKQLEKQRMGSDESQKDITAHKPAKYRRNKEEDEHDQINEEPSPIQESGIRGMQIQGAGSEENSGSRSPKSRKTNKKKSTSKPKKVSDKSKQVTKKKKEEKEAGKSRAQQDEGEFEEKKKPRGCFGWIFSLKKKKGDKKSVSQKEKM